MGRRWAALKTVSRWMTAVTGWPLWLWSGSKVYIPMISLGTSLGWENQCTKAHGYFTPLCTKKKEEVCLCNLKIKKPMHRRGISIVIHIAMSSIYEHCIIAVMCLGCSCNRKVWAVGLDHNRSPMGFWGCDKGVRDCLYVCAQRAKEWRCGVSADASEHAGVHNVIGVLVMIGLNGWKSAESSCIQPDKRARGVNR